MPNDVVTTDRLLFRRAPDDNRDQMTFGWKGPWPPPDQLVLVLDSQDRVGAVAEVEQITDEIRASTLRLVYFRLNSASEIDHSAPPDEHWFRGAEYIPDE